MSPHSEEMNCERALDLLEAFIDGDLEDAATADFESHLEGCSACRTEMALARELRDQLRQLPRLDTPATVLEEVRARVAAERGESALSGWVARRAAPLWMAAAAVLLAVVLAPRFFAPGTNEKVVVGPALAAVDAATIERATEEVRLAIAYVSRASLRTGLEIGGDLMLGRVVEPTAESLSRLMDMRRERTGEDNET
jgi:anti-sigma factor RsiW